MTGKKNRLFCVSFFTARAERVGAPVIYLINTSDQQHTAVYVPQQCINQYHGVQQAINIMPYMGLLPYQHDGSMRTLVLLL